MCVYVGVFVDRVDIDIRSACFCKYGCENVGKTSWEIEDALLSL